MARGKNLYRSSVGIPIVKRGAIMGVSKTDRDIELEDQVHAINLQLSKLGMRVFVGGCDDPSPFSLTIKRLTFDGLQALIQLIKESKLLSLEHEDQ